MTRLGVTLNDLATTIEQLSRRSRVGLFWTGATALEPEYVKWAQQRGHSGEPLLRNALQIAHRYAVDGIEPSDPSALLHALERSTPPGESADHSSTTAAQDCWICADASVRIIADATYRAGPAIEYALEPVVAATTMSIFGVAQLGGDSDEDNAMETVLSQASVANAVDFLRLATEFLRARPCPSAEDLSALESRATVLSPDA
jgi:hypothetical protein